MSQGMAQLRDAEQRAAQIVQEARQARGERIKEANVEAKRVIEGYRAEKETQFQEYVKTKFGHSGSTSADLEKTTAAELTKLTGDYNKHKDKVLAILVDKVTNVRIVVPDAWGITTKQN